MPNATTQHAGHAGEEDEVHAVSLDPATPYNTFRFDHSHPAVPPPLDHNKILGYGRQGRDGARGQGHPEAEGEAKVHRGRAGPKTRLYKWKSVSDGRVHGNEDGVTDLRAEVNQSVGLWAVLLRFVCYPCQPTIHPLSFPPSRTEREGILLP